MVTTHWDIRVVVTEWNELGVIWIWTKYVEIYIEIAQKSTILQILRHYEKLQKKETNQFEFAVAGSASKLSRAQNVVESVRLLLLLT